MIEVDNAWQVKRVNGVMSSLPQVEQSEHWAVSAARLVGVDRVDETVEAIVYVYKYSLGL